MSYVFSVKYFTLSVRLYWGCREEMKLTASSKPDCLGKGDVICLQCEILYFICPLVLGVSRGDEADGQQQARLPGQGGCHMSSV